MCKTILAALLLFGTVPFVTSAHGGFEKRAGDTVVYVTQTPISPLVGEPVTINIVLQANDSLERWKDLDVHIKLIDTYYGDESKDKVIYETTQKTDANGSLNFYYTFRKANYFDLDVRFSNPKTGKQEETGFLIQPRARSTFSGLTQNAMYVAVFLAGAVFAYGLRLNRFNK